MKQVMNVLVALLLATTSFSQSGIIPELIFQNPTLSSGTAGQNGATYKFKNVATGIDATVKIKGRSSSSVKLVDIDVSNTGWTKAFQPQLGIEGNVPKNLDWWMDFEITFYQANTNQKKNIEEFKVTAIDVDGDGVSIREYLQMNNVKSVHYGPVNYLTQQAPVNTDDDDDNSGSNKRVMGPVTNYVNIDTLGTPVMATYTYEDKNKITFRFGGKSGNVVSNAGERLNSLWFKAFNLAAPSLLPIHFYSFTAMYDKKNALLNWSAQADNNSSHFVVEKSTDGENFKEIGQVAASERITNYSFTDAAISSSTGLVYYRIQSREKTGEANYTSIKIVRLNKDAITTLTVYPNPVQRVANLTLPAAWQNKPVLLSIYNSAGMQVQNISIKTASQTETVDFQHLSKGIYVVKAQCNGEWAEQRILRN